MSVCLKTLAIFILLKLYFRDYILNNDQYIVHVIQHSQYLRLTSIPSIDHMGNLKKTTLVYYFSFYEPRCKRLYHMYSFVPLSNQPWAIIIYY